MPDYYPSEKGVIRRDSPKEAYLDKVSREVLAKGFGESLNLLPIPIAGMAAKLSLPATDVLARWIRRFRKDKPPTVPLKHIEKALKHEDKRTTFGEFGLYDEVTTAADIKDRSSMIRDMMLYGDPEGIGTEHYLGLKEKEARSGLAKLLRYHNQYLGR